MVEAPTRELVNFVERATFDDLPRPVSETIKRVLLDSIGCALGGHVVDRGKIAVEFVGDLGGKPQASVIGNRKTSWVLAAFANGELINALDFDVSGPLTNHVAPYVIPPSLAIAERVNASGKALITALALALEIGGRVGDALMPRMILREEPPYYEDAPRYSFTTTIFGAVAGAGKLLNLSEEKVANAFGIAGASTPVPATQKWQRITGPVIMTKYNCWSGWIAQLAVTAALLAEKGFTGDTTILDGNWGFWKFYGSTIFEVDRLIDELGKVWHLDRMRFKAYPVVGANHVGIELICKIIEENGIRREDIEQIVVKGGPILLEPNRAQTEVKSSTDTQFCNAYIYALAAYYGRRPSASWQTPSTFNEPRIRDLMKKVKMELHPKADELAVSRIKAGASPLFHDTIVEITALGKKFSAEGASAKGFPGNPLTDEDLKAKFRDNASYSMVKSGQVEEIIDMVYDLEKVNNITELTRLLTIDLDK